MLIQCPNCFEEFEIEQTETETICPHCDSEIRICPNCGEAYEDCSADPECPACGYQDDSTVVQCPNCFIFIRVDCSELEQGLQCPLCGLQLFEAAKQSQSEQ